MTESQTRLTRLEEVTALTLAGVDPYRESLWTDEEWERAMSALDAAQAAKVARLTVRHTPEPAQN